MSKAFLITAKSKLHNDILSETICKFTLSVYSYLVSQHKGKDTVRQLNVMSPEMVRLEQSEYLIAQLIADLCGAMVLAKA